MDGYTEGRSVPHRITRGRSEIRGGSAEPQPVLPDEVGKRPCGYDYEDDAECQPFLRRLLSNIYFWFAWFAFHPETDLYDLP